MEYYSDFRRKDILTHTTTWMNLEDIIRSEISQSQEGKYCMIPLTCGTYSGQIHRDKSRMVIARSWGREDWGVIV